MGEDKPIVHFTLLSPAARTPQRATKGSACYDLYACGDWTIRPEERCAIDTGVLVQFGPGWYGRLYGRSSLALVHGIYLAEGTMILDDQYTLGSVHLNLINRGKWEYHVKQGNRMGQLEICQVPDPVLALPSTGRDECPSPTGDSGGC